jgi:hypothetical protein
MYSVKLILYLQLSCVGGIQLSSVLQIVSFNGFALNMSRIYTMYKVFDNQSVR